MSDNDISSERAHLRNIAEKMGEVGIASALYLNETVKAAKTQGRIEAAALIMSGLILLILAGGFWYFTTQLGVIDIRLRRLEQG